MSEQDRNQNQNAVVDGDIAQHGMAPEGSDTLIKLESEDHEEVLNVIDQLRSEGIGNYVKLPQMIVCGDQSSGKSSVLEAIAGPSFPSKDNVCTRFATELILRRAPESGVTASIYPDENRVEVEKERLRNFKSPTLALDRFGEIVARAEKYIGIQKDGLSFSKDVLRVEVTGPTQPHLTLVDLPGLYHASDESQNEEGVQFVESLVLSYMQNRRSVMLAVISGKSDIALQKVTAFTRKLDPKGERTMGIITKPDTIPAGSEMEQSFYNLAQNKRMPFRLGWHVLKNRKFEERDFTLAQRHASEAAFMSQGIWASMSRNYVGVASLRPRLSAVLKDHILSQMSGFIAETQAALNEAESSLLKLGESRETISQQRQYLLNGSARFSPIVKAAVDGVYSDPFFGDSMSEDGYRRRLRAVVQNRLLDFSDTMEEKGEQRQIVEEHHGKQPADTHITRSNFVKEVQQRLRRSRGRELPGTFNPLIIGDLFFIHSEPWKAIVDRYLELLLGDVRKALISMLQDALDTRSTEMFLKHVVNPRLVELETGLRQKVAELLKPQQSGHPLTYNRDFVNMIQTIREKRLRESITEKLKSFFGQQYPQKPRKEEKISFSMTALIKTLSTQQDDDMELFACSEATDYMLAYYKVARVKFVDDFSILAVEKCLLEPLLTFYSPLTVDRLSDAVIHDIAGEDESTVTERNRLRKKATDLNRGLKTLHRLDLRGLVAVSTTPTSATNQDTSGDKPSHDGGHSEDELNDNGDEQVSDVEPLESPLPEMPKPPRMSNDMINRNEMDSPEAEIDTNVELEWARPPSIKRKKHAKAGFWEE